MTHPRGVAAGSSPAPSVRWATTGAHCRIQAEEIALCHADRARWRRSGPQMTQSMATAASCNGHLIARSPCVGKQTISLALAIALVDVNCLGQSPTAPSRSVEEQVRTIPPNSPVELRLVDGTKVRGWVSDVSATGFVLTQQSKGQLEKKQIAFQQTRSVKQVKSVKPSHTTRNILIGVGIGVAVVAVLMLSLAKAGGYL